MARARPTARVSSAHEPRHLSGSHVVGNRHVAGSRRRGKTIATFTKGQVSLSQGGTPIKWQLKAGEIKSMTLKLGGKPKEVVSYHLSYYEDGNPSSTNSNRVEITLMNMTGSGKYTKDNLMVFFGDEQAGNVDSSLIEGYQLRVRAD